jgi:hypothetical protein
MKRHELSPSPEETGQIKRKLKDAKYVKVQSLNNNNSNSV